MRGLLIKLQTPLMKNSLLKAAFVFAGYGLLLTHVGFAFAGTGFDFGFNKFLGDGIDAVEQSETDSQKKMEAEMKALEEKLEREQAKQDALPHGSEQREFIEVRCKDIRKQIQDLRETGGKSQLRRGFERITLGFIDSTLNNFAYANKSHIDTQANLQLKAIENQGKLEVVNNVMKWIIQNPGSLVGLVALSAAGISTTYFGGKLLYRYGEKIIGTPKILSWTNVPTGWQRLLGIQPQEESRLKEFVVPPGVEAQIKRIAKTIKNKIKHKRLLTNVLFYGPPGTGKTFFAKELSREAGAYCDIIAGANFSQFAEGDDITQLNKWFDSREMITKNDNKPIVVFIDEADALLVDRRLTQEDRIKRLVNTFLSRVEKPSSQNIMFVFATNHPEMLDPAVESRIGAKIEFKLPELEQRKKLIIVYTNKHIKNSKIKVSQEVESFMLDVYAPKLEGFSARDIEQVMVDLQTAVDEVGTNMLTQSIVSGVMEEKIAEHALFVKLEQEKRKKHKVSGLVGSQ